MSDWPYPNFTIDEMQCKCGCGLLPLPELMEYLQELRNQAGVPLPVTSGARCPRYNAIVSRSGPNGPHPQRLAADFLVYGSLAYAILNLAIKIGFTGIGLRQNGAHNSRFMHVDRVKNSAQHPRPWIWTY